MSVEIIGIPLAYPTFMLQFLIFACYSCFLAVKSYIIIIMWMQPLLLIFVFKRRVAGWLGVGRSWSQCNFFSSLLVNHQQPDRSDGNEHHQDYHYHNQDAHSSLVACFTRQILEWCALPTRRRSWSSGRGSCRGCKLRGQQETSQYFPF